MKKHLIVALVLVLTLSVFTGCGCRRQTTMDKYPTGMTTEPATVPTTTPTEPVTMPTEPAAPATEDTRIPEPSDMQEETGLAETPEESGASAATENGSTRARNTR